MNTHIYKEIETILNFIKYLRSQEEDTPSDTRVIYLILDYIKNSNFTDKELSFDEVSGMVNEILLGIKS